jgi:hypothetical protein
VSEDHPVNVSFRESEHTELEDTPRLRFVSRVVGDGNSVERILQERIVIREFLRGSPSGVRFEWRDVPLENE